MSGLRLLDLADDVFPTTKRALVAWQDRSARQTVLDAFAVGSIDCHLPKPTRPPDEAFHQVVTEALAEWSRTCARPGPGRPQQPGGGRDPGRRRRPQRQLLRRPSPATPDSWRSGACSC